MMQQSASRDASELAHEIRNRLNAIRLHCDIIRRALDKSSHSQHHLDIVEQEVLRLEEFVAALLRKNAE